MPCSRSRWRPARRRLGWESCSPSSACAKRPSWTARRTFADEMKELLWLVPLLPFLGALLNGVLLRARISKQAAAWIACGSVGLSCLLGIGALAGYLGSAEYAAGHSFQVDVYTWVPGGG